MILVSSCLMGLACRYDGLSKVHESVRTFLQDKAYILVCPEQMGGLSTPRPPCEMISNDPIAIQTASGDDCTEAFLKGVVEVEKILKLYPIEMAILKAKSPSCGSKQIYDGSFTRNLVQGQGVLARCLLEKGIKVINEDEIVTSGD